MFPVISNDINLNFLQLVIHLIRYMTIGRRHNNAHFLEIPFIQSIHLYVMLLMNYFHMVQLVIRYIKMKKRKRRLYKPHLLLWLLHGYRYHVVIGNLVLKIPNDHLPKIIFVLQLSGQLSTGGMFGKICNKIGFIFTG